MDSKIIAIFIIVLILGAFGAAYWFFGKEDAEKVLNTKSYYNISLNFVNDNKQIVTDYSVLINNLEYLNGTSTLNDFVRLNIPSNGTISITNINKDNQKYFRKNELLFVNDSGVKRLSIDLDEVGELQVSRNKNLIENNISLILQSKGIIKNLIICERWSSNIIKASIYNDDNLLNSIDTPLRYVNKVDRCFSSNIILYNNATTLELDYKRFGELTTEDEIKLFFIIGDYDIKGNVVYEINNTHPIIPDIEYTIK